MFIKNTITKQYKYNIKYAKKVQSYYNDVCLNLEQKKIYGCRKVEIRHKEILHFIDLGLISPEEYKHWKISQKIV